MFDYPLKSSGTDMWLVSDGKRKNISSRIHLPRHLSEFKSDLWLSVPTNVIEESSSNPLYDKWLQSPLNKPVQTTTQTSKRDASLHLCVHKNSISEWILDAVQSESGFNSSRADSVSSDCSSIEVLENGFLDFHLVNRVAPHSTSSKAASVVHSSVSEHNKWLSK